MRSTCLPALMLAALAMALLSGCAGRPTPGPEAHDPVTVADGYVGERRVLPQTHARAFEAAGATAKSAGPVSMEGAVQRAVTWHPSIAEAVGRHQQQAEAVHEARSGYLPRLGWGVDSTHDSNLLDRYRPVLNVTGSQMIYDFGKVDGRVRVAAAGTAGRRTQILMAVDELARETAYAVIEIQRNRALQAIARDQIADTKAILDLVSARTERGASTRSDQLQAETRVQAAQATLMEIDAQLNRWNGVLATLTGSTGRLDVASTMPSWLSSSCAAPDPDWARVPAIMQAQAEQEAANAELDLTRAEGLPTLALDGRMGNDVTRLGSIDPEYRIGLNVSGSLYNGGQTSARRNAAVYALDASQAAIARARVDIQRNLLEASSQIASMQQLARSLSGRQGMMRETRDLYRAQYVELGTRTLLDLLNADQELHAARFDGTNIDHDLLRLNLDCTFNTGRMRKSFSLEGQTIQGVSI